MFAFILRTGLMSTFRNLINRPGRFMKGNKILIILVIVGIVYAKDIFKPHIANPIEIKKVQAKTFMKSIIK
jgi:hypothetical protein